MSCRSQKTAYDPWDNPKVGGYPATFSAWQRAFGRPQAITASQRVLRAHPIETTGDKAFDERAAAFRAALLSGTEKAYEESSKAFTVAGLYWQGTYGDPTKVERFKDPPTNKYENYEPGLIQVASDPDLQDWMFLDFCYAAWKRVAYIDPYKARRFYVKYADELLREIPGDHLSHMSEWAAWDRSQSPPLPGYPNPAWDEAHPQPIEASSPAPEVLQQIEAADVVPVLAVPVPIVPAQVTSIPVVPANAVVPIVSEEGKNVRLGADADVGPVVPLITGGGDSVRLGADADVGAVIPVATGGGDKVTLRPDVDLPINGAVPEGDNVLLSSDLDLPIHGLPSAGGEKTAPKIEVGVPANGAVSVSSLGFVATVAEPSPPPTLGDIAKHLAVMGGRFLHEPRLMVGIGVGVGGLVGLAMIALKHFKVWPFNKVGRDADESDDQGESENDEEGGEDTTSFKGRLRRRHPRSWEMEQVWE